MNTKWSAEKETLIDLILVQKLPYEQIGRMYNCSGSNIKKVAIRIGIDLEDRRVKNPNETFNKGLLKIPLIVCKECKKEFKKRAGYYNEFCSNSCRHQYRFTKAYEKVTEGDYSVMRANFGLKRYKDAIIEEQDNKCAICSMSPKWNNKRLVFIIDHIDGNAANNKRDNLRCVCPNCDSQLDTYKSKNKNGARHYYRYKNKGE